MASGKPSGPFSFAPYRTAQAPLIPESGAFFMANPEAQMIEAKEAETWPATHTIESFCVWAGVSRMTAHRLMKAGTLPYRKAGRRVLILKSDARRWLDELPRGESEKPTL